MQFLIDNGCEKWFADEASAKKAEQQGFTVTKVETPEMSAPSVMPVQIVSVSTESFQLR